MNRSNIWFYTRSARNV